jgi:hypothetical protein
LKRQVSGINTNHYVNCFSEGTIVYGMIHKSIHGMVVEHLGEEGWKKIADQAEVDEQHLLSMEATTTILSTTWWKLPLTA